LGKAKRFLITVFTIIAIMGIISFAASYSNLQTSTQEVKNANQDVKAIV